MAPYLFMAYSEEASALGDAAAPTAEMINGAFRDVNDPPFLRFVGPGPRITRVSQVLLGTVTRVAQPIKVDDPALDEESARQIVARRLYEKLEALQVLRSWRQVQVTPYNERVSGPLAFWESGQATRSATINESPTVISTAPSENPVGPNDPALRPPSIGEDIEEWARRVGRGASSLMPILYLGGGLLALVYLGPVVFKTIGFGADALTALPATASRDRPAARTSPPPVPRPKRPSRPGRSS